MCKPLVKHFRKRIYLTTPLPFCLYSGMSEYLKQLAKFRRRREKILAMVASGMKRSAVAKALKISRQRVNQIVVESRQ